MMKAELLEDLVVVGQDVVLKIEVDRDGHREVFVVTASAPNLFAYAPYVAEVRRAIVKVIKQHEAELKGMFSRMG